MGYAGEVVPAAMFIAVCKNRGIEDITDQDINYIEEHWL